MTDNAICPGFKFAGIAAGLKKKGGRDLGLIYSEIPAKAAAVFTTNRVKAAPVLLDMKRVQSGMCQAVIANSGNANCCTGDKGMSDAISMTRYAANYLNIAEELVLAASTGVIGMPFAIEKIEAAAPELVRSLKTDGISDFAQAIMTTDTVPKIVSRTGEVGGKKFTITGVAKGAGMICPNMATMLCFICTDADPESAFLKEALLAATERSFNRITIDGDTSTNDTVILMANGMSRVEFANSVNEEIFQTLLDDVMMTLAKMVVKDGEGATKLAEVIVKGAMTEKDAYIIANTIANSNLVKTALFGQDANWGRILAAAGRSGIPFVPEQTDLFFNEVQMVKNGMSCGAAAEAEAT